MRASPDSSEQRSLRSGPTRLSTSGESETGRYPGVTSFWTTERRNLNLGVLKAKVRCEGWVFFFKVLCGHWRTGRLGRTDGAS